MRVFSLDVHVLFSARTPKLLVVKDDPDDDKFIECTIPFRAHFVTTGDKHPAAIQEYMGIHVAKPAVFLKECNKGRP